MASKESGETRNETDSENPQENAKNLLAEKKAELRKDIRKLKAMKFQAECSLNITKFGNVEETPILPKLPNMTKLAGKDVPDLRIDLGCKLYELSGMFCDKFREDEYVFKFSSSVVKRKDNFYAIQILHKEEPMKLGKWFMPLGWDMDEVLSETPLDDTSANLKNFVKNCKQRVDCYSERMEQYENLKIFFNSIKHCSVDANLMFTQMKVKLFGVKDKAHEQFHNIVLYLVYKSKGTKPFKLHVDLDNLKLDPLPDETNKRLRSYFKSFKYLSLEEAFKKTVNASDAEFQWDIEGPEDSPLELNDSSTSESETNLSRLNRVREKLKKSGKARREKRKMQETRSSERGVQKRKRVQSPQYDKSSENTLNLHTIRQQSETRSPKNVSENNKPGPSGIKTKSKAAQLDVITTKIKTGKITIKPQRKKMSPKKPEGKLRQSTLTFEARNFVESDNTKNRTPTDLQKSRKVYTSTPSHHDKKNFTLGNGLDISNIESSTAKRPKKVPSKLDKIEETARTPNHSSSPSSDSEVESLENRSALLQDLAAVASKRAAVKSVFGRGKSASQRGKSAGRGKNVGSSKRGKRGGKK